MVGYTKAHQIIKFALTYTNKIVKRKISVFDGLHGQETHPEIGGVVLI
jgi:hypothetical protein